MYEMGKKVIKLSLNPSDIDRAIRELEKYKIDFQAKVDTYRRRVAEELAKTAALNFGSSMMEDNLRSGMRKPNVSVNVDERGSISVVVADGEDAVWCEFGAGVYHNGSVGSSPNPYGNGLGFTIGNYGFGYGRKKVWGYYDNGQLVLTHGTPASMPMYNAVQTITIKAIEIAREVFQ